MNPHTNTLFSCTTQTGALSTRVWYAVQRDTREHMLLAVNISAGTGTIVVEGRIDANSPITTIDTFTGSTSEFVARFPQICVTASAATGLTAVVTIDRPAKLV